MGMLYELTESQKDIVESVREFGLKHFTRDAVKRWKKEQGLPDDVVKEFVSLDFSPVALFADDGRREDTVMTLVLIIEELTRIAGTSLPFQTDLLNLCILSEFATDDLLDYARKEFLKTGRFAFSIAVSEPQAGSDTKAMQTKVQTVDGRILLNGHKTFVNNGEYAPYILVAAIDSDSTEAAGRLPVSFWMVPNSAKGVESYPIEKKGQRMIPFSDIVFRDVELEPHAMVTDSKEGPLRLYRSFEYGRVMTCASAVGLAQAAMDDAMCRVRERQAFGSTLMRFQQIEAAMVDMEVKLRNMRNMVYDAALAMDAGSPDARLAVTLMKRYVPKAATQVADSAIQVFGGLGYTEEERVFGIWEDCRGNQIAEGTDEIMVHVGGPLLSKRYAASPYCQSA